MQRPIVADKNLSKKIDDLIDELDDWRGEKLAEIRQLRYDALPNVEEHWKWIGSPVWETASSPSATHTRSRSYDGYHGSVSSKRVPRGVVHKLPRDLREALIGNDIALDAWKDITPLARNEFICWVEDAKQITTRERRIRRTSEELEEGKRRPCCWPGCNHRERNGR